MEEIELKKTKDMIEQLSALCKAIHRVDELLSHGEAVSEEEIHNAKSILYAAIEQTGVKAERLSTVQRMLRELFALVTARPNIRDYEREVGRRIVSDIRERYLGKI